jgi:hypothetical protein
MPLVASPPPRDLWQHHPSTRSYVSRWESHQPLVRYDPLAQSHAFDTRSCAAPKSLELASTPRLQSLPRAEGYYRVHAPQPPNFTASAPLYTARPAASTPFRAPLLSSSAFSRSQPLSSASSVAAGQLYPGQLFRRSAELSPLPPDYARDARVLPLVSGRANPRAFAVPQLAELHSGAHSARCFPARAQCTITKFKENLLAHAIVVDF